MTRRLATAADALRRVLANPDMRRAQLAWMLGYAAEWSWLVALWVYAYQTSGVVVVGILGLARTLPAALLSPALSTITDRLPRHRVLLGLVVGFLVVSPNRGRAFLERFERSPIDVAVAANLITPLTHIDLKDFNP